MAYWYFCLVDRGETNDSVLSPEVGFCRGSSGDQSLIQKESSPGKTETWSKWFQSHTFVHFECLLLTVFAEVGSSNLSISNAINKNSLSLAVGNTFHFLQIHSRVITKFRKDILSLSLCRCMGECVEHGSGWLINSERLSGVHTNKASKCGNVTMENTFES